MLPIAGMHQPLSRLAITLVALGASGCYASWDIGRGELVKLHGYRAPQQVQLTDVRGSPIAFDGESELVFRDRETSFEGRFEAIDVRGSTLFGQRRDGHALTIVDLGRVEQVHVKRLSVGGTTGLVVGVTLGAATVAAMVAGAVALSKLNLHWDFGNVGSRF